jgi:integrase
VVETIRERVAGRAPDDLIFPGRDGSFIPLRSFRRNDWNPAMRAAGFFDLVEKDDRKKIQRPDRTPYGMRHTYAAFSLAAGVTIYTLARRMGTSAAMIDKTYEHLAPDADDVERDLLDEYDRRQAKEDDADEAADRI